MVPSHGGSSANDGSLSSNGGHNEGCARLTKRLWQAASRADGCLQVVAGREMSALISLSIMSCVCLMDIRWLLVHLQLNLSPSPSSIQSCLFGHLPRLRRQGGFHKHATWFEVQAYPSQGVESSCLRGPENWGKGSWKGFS